MERMTLIFTGEDGSMGLHNGKKYKCTVAMANGHIVVYTDNNFRCPYTISGFLANWEIDRQAQILLEP